MTKDGPKKSLIPEPISLKNLFDTEWPEEVFIGGGILSRGDSMIIGAESKAGKSTLIQGLIRQMMTGGSFLGFKVLKPLRVLFMQAEIRESRLKQRISENYKSVDTKILGVNFAWNTKGLILIERDIMLIKKHIRSIKPDILIIDPLINFHTYDENNATQMANLFRKLDMLKTEFNMSLILTQHFRKKTGEGKKGSLLEMLRGSSALRGWADITIAIEGRTSHEYRTLEFDTRNSDQAIKRIIKYDPKKKEFDWYDPIEIIFETLKIEMGEKELITNQVVGIITKKCGHLVNKNRNKAFEIKESMIMNGMISMREEGNKVFLSVNHDF